ncbi:MAG: hypothetical protein DIU78_022065 [Pseudomonadota bacterium]
MTLGSIACARSLASAGRKLGGLTLALLIHSTWACSAADTSDTPYVETGGGGGAAAGATASGGTQSGSGETAPALNGGAPGASGGLSAAGSGGSSGAAVGGVSGAGAASGGGASPTTGGLSPSAGGAGGVPVGGMQSGGAGATAGNNGGNGGNGGIAGGNGGSGGIAGNGGGSSGTAGSPDFGGTAGTLGEGGAAGDAGGSGADPDCPKQGGITYTLNRAPSPTPMQQMAYERIQSAMDEAVAFYNCHTEIVKSLSVSYEPSVPTADGNVNGSIRFGSTASMNPITAMHEIAHTLGVGSNEYRKFVKDGIFTGEIATNEIRAITGDPTAVVNSDGTHFWPYGLNYTSEVMSDEDLVNHCRMVVAIRADMGL